jgi:hypothetical protein
MINSESARMKNFAYELHNIGTILDRQGQYDEITDYHRQALDV